MNEVAEVLDAETVRQELIDLCHRMPGAVNPRAGAACAYTDPGDPNRHCLIGQWAAEKGWTLPSPLAGRISADLVAGLGWPIDGDAVHVLRTWQSVADGSAESWGDVVRVLAS